MYDRRTTAAELLFEVHVKRELNISELQTKPNFQPTPSSNSAMCGFSKDFAVNRLTRCRFDYLGH